MLIDFPPFTFDDERFRLLKSGSVVQLSVQGCKLLAVLLDERPRVVKTADLHDRLWPDAPDPEATLDRVVAEVRSALGEVVHTPRFVRTVHGIGYAFLGDAVERQSESSPPPHSCLCWLTLGDRQFALEEGENLIGRDLDVAVRIEDKSVSRRHAKLIVAANTATLEDLGSKNGSFVGGSRISGPVELDDGADVQFGSIVLTFHRIAAPISTPAVLPLA